ncbi:21969_t:CDS:1, partial [Entrophospora sp. SA101]
YEIKENAETIKHEGLKLIDMVSKYKKHLNIQIGITSNEKLIEELNKKIKESEARCLLLVDFILDLNLLLVYSFEITTL